MEGHDILIILAVGVIVIIQLRIWLRSRSLIREYIHIFKNVSFKTAKAYIPLSKIDAATASDLSKYYQSLEDVEEEVVEITYIKAYDNQGQDEVTEGILFQIVQAINSYLLKNKGATGDFLLVKDVVERYCDAKHNEIETQLPMPLYLGLMGTMLGIIIGIGHIAMNVGFDKFIEAPQDSIGVLMGGVALAMIASLVGIILTTYGSWKTKGAASVVEDGKNQFYTWVQTELLPVLGGTENSLMMLQKNLLKFNRSFSANTAKLDRALQQVGTSYQDQMGLIQSIQQLNIEKIATANVSVLRELQACTPLLEQFGRYIHLMNEFISQVNALNNNMALQNSRTQLIEEMGTFFKEEVKEIEQRKVAINQAVGMVDDNLQKLLYSLQENGEKNMQAMNEALVKKQDVFNKALEEQQEIFKKKIQENGNLLDELKKLDNVALAVNAQNEKLDLELERLNALRDGIGLLEARQTQKMDELIAVVKKMPVRVVKRLPVRANRSFWEHLFGSKGSKKEENHG